MNLQIPIDPLSVEKKFFEITEKLGLEILIFRVAIHYLIAKVLRINSQLYLQVAIKCEASCLLCT